MSEKIPEGEEMPDPFDLNFQFYLYLKKLGLDPRTIPFGQYGEIKRAFYGGVGQMLMIIAMKLSELSDDDANERTLYLTQQITEFWKTEIEKSTQQQN